MENNSNLRIFEVIGNDRDDEWSSQYRILRPKVGLFVGRQRESNLLNERLCLNIAPINRSVIISGAAGIGKSYLANKLVCELRRKYIKQKWISCSRENELDEDISVLFQHRCEDKQKTTVGSEMDTRITTQMKVEKAGSKTQLGLFEDWLFVLDDVCSTALCTAFQLIF